MLSRTALITVTLLAAAFVASCADESTLKETGAADCRDGRDNDGDGTIDCQDIDCYPMLFCSPPPDGGPPADLLVITSDRGIKPQDSQPPPDTKPPPSSYGVRCSYTSGEPKPCSDGKNLCVPSKYSSGFCTQRCDYQGAYCPPGPAGTKSYCGYNVSTSGTWLWYCIFLCSSNACPNNTQCYGGFCF